MTLLGCFCPDRAITGSDASAITTRATKDGDHFVLNGVKQFITTGKHAQVAIVLRSPTRRPGKKDFLLPRTDRDAGLYRRPYRGKMGQKTAIAQIIFENCRIPASCLLGKRRWLPDRVVEP